MFTLLSSCHHGGSRATATAPTPAPTTSPTKPAPPTYPPPAYLLPKHQPNIASPPPPPASSSAKPPPPPYPPPAHLLPSPPLTTTASSSNDNILILLHDATRLCTSQLPCTKYRMGEMLSKGGFGVVHMCANRFTGDRMAAKLSAPDMLGMVQREAAFLKVFRHPNIVSIVDAYQLSNKSSWIVLEYMNGGDLQELARYGGGWPQPLVTYVAREILQALDFLHEHRALHRDIKLDNILWDSRGRLKLADFGLATILTKDAPMKNSNCGTAGYRAPEILRREPYDTKVDLWSLGVLLMTLTQGREQRWDQFEGVVLTADEPYPVFDKRCQIKPPLKHFLCRMLVKNAAERAPARALLEDACVQQFSCAASAFQRFATALTDFNTSVDDNW